MAGVPLRLDTIQAARIALHRLSQHVMEIQHVERHCVLARSCYGYDQIGKVRVSVRVRVTGLLTNTINSERS